MRKSPFQHVIRLTFSYSGLTYYVGGQWRCVFGVMFVGRQTSIILLQRRCWTPESQSCCLLAPVCGPEDSHLIYTHCTTQWRETLSLHDLHILDDITEMISVSALFWRWASHDCILFFNFLAHLWHGYYGDDLPQSFFIRSLFSQKAWQCKLLSDPLLHAAKPA